MFNSPFFPTPPNSQPNSADSRPRKPDGSIDYFSPTKRKVKSFLDEAVTPATTMARRAEEEALRQHADHISRAIQELHEKSQHGDDFTDDLLSLSAAINSAEAQAKKSSTTTLVFDDGQS